MNMGQGKVSGQGGAVEERGVYFKIFLFMRGVKIVSLCSISCCWQALLNLFSKRKG